MRISDFGWFVGRSRYQIQDEAASGVTGFVT
jgi:hypothetical protein